MNKILKKIMLATSIFMLATFAFAQPVPQRTQPSTKSAPQRAEPARDVPQRAEPAREAPKRAVPARDPREDINNFFADFDKFVKDAERANRTDNKRELDKCRDNKNSYENRYRKLRNSREWTRKDSSRYDDLSNRLDRSLQRPEPKKAAPAKAPARSVPQRAAPATR